MSNYRFDFRVEGISYEDAAQLFEIIEMTVELSGKEMAGGVTEVEDGEQDNEETLAEVPQGD